MGFRTKLHNKPDTVLLRLLLTIFGWFVLVIVCGLCGGEFLGFFLAILVTLIAAMLFVGFFIEGLVRLIIHYPDCYREHQRSADR